MSENFDDTTFDDTADRLRRSTERTAPELSPEIVASATSRPAPRIVNRPRRLQIAGGITLAIAAVTVGALVIGNPAQQAPLFTAGANGQNAPAAERDDASSDLKIANWVNYEYVPGDGLSDKGGSGHVYQLKRAGTAEDVLRTAAAALGLKGSPAKSQYFDEAYPSYVIGAEDGTAPSLTLSWLGTGDWWYNNPAAYPPVVCEPVPDIAPDDPNAVEPTCETPATTTNLAPSEAEARAIAKELFAKTGLTVSAKSIRVTADEWQTSASANLVVDGVATAIDWGIGWSPNGEIAWAYGHSIDVVDRGSFGTISEKDAVARLADWRWFGAAGPDYQGGAVTFAADDAVAGGSTSGSGGSATEKARESDSDPATDPNTPVTSPTDPVAPGEPTPGTDPTAEPGTEPGAEPTTEPTAEPIPEPTLEPEPVPTPETVIVTVNVAEATLLQMWDSKGNVWLVPGYAMQNPEGWWNTVVSLVEGVIELPEPMPIEPLILDDTRVSK
jgi:hypothetical protein